ncbi:Pentatricopeptide repeat-containing protein [Nymphaea thermarum]|nr:Pentatricopeptide repeat-containing protein [Nymphaea thermarum]
MYVSPSLQPSTLSSLPHSFSVPKPPPWLLPGKSHFKLIAFSSTSQQAELAKPSPSQTTNSSDILPSVIHQIPPNFTSKDLISIVRRHGDGDTAVSVFNWALEQPNFVPESSLVEVILHQLGSEGSFEQMRALLEDPGCTVTPGMFLAFVESYAKLHMVDEAVGILSEMEKFEVEPDIFIYNNLLNLLVDENKLKMVESVYSDMGMRGVSPDVSTFNVLIKALCKAHQIRTAISMMEEMSDYGLVPDEKTFTTIMQGYIEQDNLDSALEIKERMTRSGCKLTSVTINVLLHGYYAVTYGTLIGGLCKGGRVHLANKLLRTIMMKGIVPAPQTYNPIIQSLYKQQKTKEAMRLFKEMIEKGEPPNALTYKIVFRGLCCGGGPIGEAVDFLKEMMEKGFLPEYSALSMLAEGLCTLSMESTLYELIDLVMQKANFSGSDVAVVRGFLRVGKLHDAMAAVGRVLKTHKTRERY